MAGNLGNDQALSAYRGRRIAEAEERARLKRPSLGLKEATRREQVPWFQSGLRRHFPRHHPPPPLQRRSCQLAFLLAAKGGGSRCEISNTGRAEPFQMFTKGEFLRSLLCNCHVPFAAYSLCSRFQSFAFFCFHLFTHFYINF